MIIDKSENDGADVKGTVPKEVTLFDDITALLSLKDITKSEIESKVNEIKTKIGDAINTDNIFSNNVKTLERLMSNIYFEYI